VVTRFYIRLVYIVLLCVSFIVDIIFIENMSGGCVDLRKRWDNLVGKPEKEAVEAIKHDGRKPKPQKLNIFLFFIN
jgi:hypothetical protein